jgi:hypothetical protein
MNGVDELIRTRSIAIPAIVEKCLSSTRAGTRQKAIDAILFYVELDTPDPVLVPSPPTSPLSQIQKRKLKASCFVGRINPRFLRQTPQTRRSNNHRHEGNIQTIRRTNSLPQTGPQTPPQTLCPQRQKRPCRGNGLYPRPVRVVGRRDKTLVGRVEAPPAQGVGGCVCRGGPGKGCPGTVFEISKAGCGGNC